MGGKGSIGKTRSELSAGLRGWVSDYKAARKYGNVKLASEIKANIDKKIKKLGLVKSMVYGKK